MSSALNIGLSTGNVGIGNRSYNNRVVPVSDGRINGVNITELNRRVRASSASAVACVSSWVTRVSAANNDWRAVCWASELSLFVAVANTGTGNRVMTSPDGVNWTTRMSAADNQWYSVCWAPEMSLFVAVATSGTGNRVMTSPDGVNWTTRMSAADNQWWSVCWAPEVSLFVATADTGSSNRVMTSPDGVSWTTRTSAANIRWLSVCWAPELSLFVAVALSGTGNRVMTSPDGITWTTRTSATDNNWRSVCWAPELSLFAAVAQSGTGNRVMTSPDGIAWTARTSAADSTWQWVCWAPELSLFVAIASTGTGNHVMTSPEGITWTTRISAADNGWNSVCWAPELSSFAAVAISGTGTRVQTSAIGMPNSKSVVKALPSQMMVSADGNVGIGTTTPMAKIHILDTGSIIIPSGLSIQQPTNAIQGMIRFNTSSKRLEFYNGVLWMSISGSDVYNVYLTNAVLHLDPSEITSFPKAGSVWYDLSEKRTNAIGVNVDFRSTAPEYFNFNGSTTYFDLQISNPAGAWAHSISFWMQINVAQSTLSSTAVPFQIGTAATSQYSALLIDINGGSWFFYSNDTSFAYSFNQGQWYNITLTYNGGAANSTNKKLYINNVSVPLTGTSTTPLNIPANAVGAIGKDRGRNTYFFPGKIGNFMIYNGVLDSSAITQNFSALRSRYLV